MFLSGISDCKRNEVNLPVAIPTPVMRAPTVSYVGTSKRQTSRNNLKRVPTMRRLIRPRGAFYNCGE